MGIFSQYLEKGIQPLPIGYLTKYPCVLDEANWKPYDRLGRLFTSPVTPEDAALWDTWLEHGCGVGLAMGEHSGIIALDFDSDDETTAKIKELLPLSPARKIGKKGITAFYKYNGEKNKKWKSGGKDYILEILSTGNQTVVPPSIHPSTQLPYEWVGEYTLLEVDKNDLPSLPEGFYDAVEKLTGNSISVPAPAPLFKENETTQSDVEEALSFITPDCGYDDWLHIGMALQDELGDSGFQVWDNWSKGGSKYPKKGDPTTWQKWKSFKNHGITVNTLFQMARLAGYSPEPVVEELGFKIPFIERLKLEAAPSGAKERIEDGFPEKLCSSYGLVGDIQKWITQSALYPQPALALAASIAAVGAIMSHRVEGATRSRTNMYCMSVAPSGSGKEHPRQCIEKLMAQTENTNLVGGDPASSTGLLKSLQNGKGRRIIQMDEFGRVLKGINSKNASAHVAGLPTVMMKLFSSAGTTYYGSEYANHDGSMERKDIDQPCLCLHASTVPEHLFQAMSGTDAIDGFLSRWLIFENQGYPDLQIPKANRLVVPSDIVEKVKKWKQPEDGGNLATVGIKLKTIPFDEEAGKLAEDFCQSMRKRAQEKQKNGDPTYAIWTRTFEHATKLALVAHEDGIVSKKVMQWALEVATYCSQYICDQATLYIADNEYEKGLKHVLSVVKKAGSNGVTKSKITRATQYLNSKTRGDILLSLLDGDQIVAEQNQSKTKPVTIYRYVRR